MANMTSYTVLRDHKGRTSRYKLFTSIYCTPAEAKKKADAYVQMMDPNGDKGYRIEEKAGQEYFCI